MKHLWLIFVFLPKLAIPLWAQESLFRQDTYTQAGLLLSEDYFKDGVLWQRLQFFYNTDNLLVATHIYENNLLKEQLTYVYKVDGTVWQIIKNDKLSFFTQTAIISQIDEGLRVIALNQGLLKTIYQQTGTLKENTEYFYNTQGQLTSANFTLENNRLQEFYNTEGRLTKQTYFYNNQEIETFNYSYNNDGVIIESRHKVIDNDEEMMRYNYNDDYTLQKASRYLAGNLQQETLPIPGGKQEFYYREGRLIYTETIMDTQQ